MFLSQQQREQHEREALHHALVSSEEQYVSELECLVLRLAVPLQSASERMSLSASSLATVFGLLQHLHSFHRQFLTILREEVSVTPSFARHIGFIKMYTDYLPDIRPRSISSPNGRCAASPSANS